MIAAFLITAMLQGQLAPGQTREPHPLAPSLPVLSKEETAKIEAVVKAFVAADTGKTKGPESVKAFADLQRLGPESVFVLIDWFNRTAEWQDSCPAVILGRKIAKILVASEDREFLTTAKELIGAGVSGKRHMAVVDDLKLIAQLRRSFLANRPLAQAPAYELKRMLTSTIAKDRLAALEVVDTKKLPWGDDLIKRLDDKDVKVRNLAHAILVRRAGTDHGSVDGDSQSQRQEAIDRWASWWQQNKN